MIGNWHDLLVQFKNFITFCLNSHHPPPPSPPPPPPPLVLMHTFCVLVFWYSGWAMHNENGLCYNSIISFVHVPSWTYKWPVLNVLSYFTASNLAGGATAHWTVQLGCLAENSVLTIFHPQQLLSCYWEKHFWWDDKFIGEHKHPSQA